MFSQSQLSAEKGVAGLVDIDWEYGESMGIAEIGVGGKRRKPGRSTRAIESGSRNGRTEKRSRRNVTVYVARN